MDKSRKLILIIVNALLVLICLGCVIGIISMAHTLDSQYEYKRWQGDNEMEFAQVSCFLPNSSTVGLSQVYAFRTAMMNAFKEASIESETSPFIDAWSCEGSLSVASDKTNSSVAVTAVGGDFFEFHPLRLLSGSYINEDSAPDLVLIDEELAWMLYGSNDVAGMTMRIGQDVFTVAGVIDRNDDFATKKAYTSGIGLFMNYSTYCGIVSASGTEENPATVPGITCYEVCLPDPVKNFAINLVESKFPASDGEVLCNTGRFSFKNLMGISKNLASRAISSKVTYPYWENAARYIENKAALLLLIALFSLVIPLVTAVWFAVNGIKRGSEKLSEGFIPDAKDKLQEAVRKRQRKRYEKKHPV